MAAIECNLFQGATGDLLLIRGNGADGSIIAPRLRAEVTAQPDADGWFTWQQGGQRKNIERMGRLNWFAKDSQWNDRLDSLLPSSGEIDLTLHLHGAPTVVESNFLRAGSSGVLVNVTLPGLSTVYTERFRDPNVFHRILDETGAQLKAHGLTDGQRFRRVTVSSFSAGFGGVRELLKNEGTLDRIDALVMADSIYAGYTGDSATRGVNPVHMVGFLKFARAAAQGRKRMIISYSQQRPDGYASTTETADYLISQLGGVREIIAETWPGGLKLLSRFRKGHLEIYGLAGDTGADHMRHLQNLSGFLGRSCE